MSDIGRTVERCTLAGAGITATLTDDATDQDRETLADLEAYFRRFAMPESGEPASFGGHKCLKCDEPLTGFLGSFTWGLVHGEGFCRKCKWPGRAHHFIKDRHGEELASLQFVVLQYHPDEVEERKAS
jgi:hypothetical protein